MIANCELDFVVEPTQLHFKMSHAAIFDRVVQGLLQDSEETKGDILGQSSWDIVSRKSDFNFMPLCNFSTETSACYGQAKIFQL